MEEKNKTRTWLLYAVIVVFIAAAGALVYRLVDGGEDSSRGSFIDDFSGMFESIKKRSVSFSDAWAGRRSYAVAEWVATDAITFNKKNTDEPVQVIFDDVDCGTDVDCFAEQKKKIQSGDYEISFEYEDGYVYLIKLEKL